MRIRKLLCLCAVVAACTMAAWAVPPNSVSGQVADPSGAVVTGAAVTVTDRASGAASRTATDAQGGFQVGGLTDTHYVLRVTKTGFQTFTQEVTLQSDRPAVLHVQLTVRSVAQSVEVHATAPGATPVPTQQEVLQSNQTLRVLSRKQMDMAGPLAGAGQIVAQSPGANVVSYGNTGGTKSTIVLNGINQGWGGYGGYNYPGSLGVTLDGIPIADAATGLWPSASLPRPACSRTRM